MADVAARDFRAAVRNVKTGPVTLAEVIKFLGTAEQTYWAIMEHFDPRNAAPALGDGLRRNWLARREEPAGWVYRQHFGGVDIDAAHRVAS